MCIRFFFSLLAWLGLNSHRIISSDKDRGGFECERLGIGCVTARFPHGCDLCIYPEYRRTTVNAIVGFSSYFWWYCEGIVVLMRFLAR